MFLLTPSPAQVNKPVNSNELAPCMPLDYASDEADAQIKMGALVENAIIKSLYGEYQVKIEEYDDRYLFGKINRPRWLRINGPFCDNWSCQIIAPIPTKSALQWEGKMMKTNKNRGICYVYDTFPLESSLGVVKISNEYNKSGKRYVEGIENLQFDYLGFFENVSKNLPEWVELYVSRLNEPRYKLIHGVKLPVTIK